MKTIFSVFPTLANRLAKDQVSSVWLYLRLVYFYITRKIFKVSRPFVLRLQYNDITLSLTLLYAADLAVLGQLYVNDEYEECPMADPKVIIDLGAHFGDSTLYYHTRFPTARIIAVEPSPANYQRLLAHTKDITNITCVQAAIGAKDGEITLYEQSNSLGNSVRERESSTHGVSVPQQTLSNLLLKHVVVRADIVKFDIEGAESELFANSNAEKLSRFYIGEIHPDLMHGTPEQFLQNFATAVVHQKSVGHNNRSIVTALYYDS